MPGYRIDRTNDDIKLVLSELLRSIKDPRVNQGMISITRVDTTSDLRYCKAYLSVYGIEDEKEFKNGLKSASGWLRRELGRRLKLRNTPEFVFEIDSSIEHGAHINKIISEPGFIKNDSEQTPPEGIEN